jgi:hypothetical protein
VSTVTQPAHGDESAEDRARPPLSYLALLLANLAVMTWAATVSGYLALFGPSYLAASWPIPALLVAAAVLSGLASVLVFRRRVVVGTGMMLIPPLAGAAIMAATYL